MVVSGDTANPGGDVLAVRAEPWQRWVVQTDPMVQVEAFARHLGAVRGQSEHTQRAYLGDLRNLMAFVRDRGINDLSDVKLSDLRSWLAHQSENGAARSTIARRAASARAFLRWASRTGVIETDPSLRLVAPQRLKTLPGVLKQDEASALLEVAAIAATSSKALASSCLSTPGRVFRRWGATRRSDGSVSITPVRLAQRRKALADAALRAMVDRAAPFSDW